MLTNQTNFLVNLKFRKKNLIRLTYLGVFLLYLIGSTLITVVEKNLSEAYVYFGFGLTFSIISFVTAKFIPNDRDKTLKFFKVGLSGYSLFIILFEMLIFLANKGGDGGITVNTIKTICAFSKILIPLGLILWQAKKWTFLTGINKSKRETINHIRENGNNGLN